MYATKSRSSLDRPRLNPKDKGRATEALIERDLQFDFCPRIGRRRRSRR